MNAVSTIEMSGPGVDEVDLRTIMGNFGTGVTVITAHDGSRPLGFACQSVTSLSLDPPYVSFCPSTSSTSWPPMRESGQVCINVLAHDQQDVSGRFATSGVDKFAGVGWSRARNGAAALHGVIARIEATVEFEHEAGDHTIVVCRVTGLEAERHTDPLLFFRGGYGSFNSAQEPAGAEPTRHPHLASTTCPSSVDGERMSS